MNASENTQFNQKQYISVFGLLFYMTPQVVVDLFLNFNMMAFNDVKEIYNTNSFFKANYDFILNSDEVFGFQLLLSVTWSQYVCQVKTKLILEEEEEKTKKEKGNKN